MAIRYITGAAQSSTSGLLIGAGPTSLRRISAKLGQVTAGQGNAVIVGIGDSITRGTKSGDGAGGSDATQGYRGILNQLANQMNGPALPTMAESVFGYGGYEQAFATFDGRIAVSGAFDRTAGGGIRSGGGQIFQAGAAGTWTYTPVQSVNTMDLYYLQNGASFTYSVDGATAVTVNVGSNGNAIKKTTISLGTTGTMHSVVVSWVSGSVYLLGANAYNNVGKRLDLLNFGWHGSKTQNWVDGAATPQAWTYNNLIGAVNADLVIFALGGTNDLGTGVSVATYAANLATLVGKIKALPSPPDILLMTAPPRADVAGYEASLKDYSAAMKAFGAANGIPVYDRGAWYGDAAGAVSLGLLTSDLVHPSRAGYVRDASDLRTILRPGLVGSAASVDSSGITTAASQSAVIGVPDAGWTSTTKIRDIARAKGVKFGSMFVTSDYTGSTTYATMLGAESDIFVAGVEQKGVIWAPSISGNTITFDFSASDAWMPKVSAMGGQYRFHVLLYPSHDVSWANTTNITSANWMSLIDQMIGAAVNRMVYYQTTYGLTPTSIDVTNENCDGNGTASFRSTPWFTAAAANPYNPNGITFTSNYPAGASYITYAFVRAKALLTAAGLGSVPLYQCHDNLEECGPLSGIYFQNNAASVLNLVTQLVAQGAPIDGVNSQGHLHFRRPYEDVAYRSLLTSITALKSPNTGLPLKIIMGELDVQSGQAPQIGNLYPNTEYDRQAALKVRAVLDTVLPFIARGGNELVLWGLGDSYSSWGTTERPCPFDRSATPARKTMYDDIKAALANSL